MSDPARAVLEDGEAAVTDLDAELARAVIRLTAFVERLDKLWRERGDAAPDHD